MPQPGTLESKQLPCLPWLRLEKSKLLGENRGTLLKYQTLVFEQIAYYIMLDGGEEVKVWIIEKMNPRHLLLLPVILSNVHLSREMF